MRFLSPLTRFLILILTVVYFTTNCAFAYSHETSLWAERQKNLRVAQLPTLRGPGWKPEFGMRDLPQSEIRNPKFLIPRPAFHLPNLLQYGTIRQITPPTNGKPEHTVLLIEDIHQNHEAQENIAKAIKTLMKKGRVERIALEGACGPIDVTPLRSFPYPEVTQNIADFLLRKNKIQGPLYAALTYGRHPRLRGDDGLPTSESIPPVIGIDDARLYQANVNAYQSAAPHIPTLTENHQNTKRILDERKSKTFSSALYLFDKQVESYRSGEIQIGEYVRALERFSLFENGTQLNKFLTALTMESSIDFKRVEFERRHLLSRLLKSLREQDIEDLLDASVAYKSQRIGHSDFYTLLQELAQRSGVQLQRFPAMNQYIRYLLLTDDIDQGKLFKELKETEETIYSRLTTTKEEKMLVQESTNLYREGKLINFNFTKQEWEEYKKESSSPRSKSKTIRPGALQYFETFYRQAEARDKKMAENLLKSLEAVPHPDSGIPPLTVVVAGGFHSQGLINTLAGENSTTITFVPNVSKLNTTEGAKYLSVFTQEKTPLDQLFSGEALFLAQPPFPRGVRGELALLQISEAFRRNLATAAPLLRWIRKILPLRVTKMAKKGPNIIHDIRRPSGRLRLIVTHSLNATGQHRWAIAVETASASAQRFILNSLLHLLRVKAKEVGSALFDTGGFGWGGTLRQKDRALQSQGDPPDDAEHARRLKRVLFIVAVVIASFFAMNNALRGMTDGFTLWHWHSDFVKKDAAFSRAAALGRLASGSRPSQPNGPLALLGSAFNRVTFGWDRPLDNQTQMIYDISLQSLAGPHPTIAPASLGEAITGNRVVGTISLPFELLGIVFLLFSVDPAWGRDWLLLMIPLHWVSAFLRHRLRSREPPRAWGMFLSPFIVYSMYSLLWGAVVAHPFVLPVLLVAHASFDLLLMWDNTGSPVRHALSLWRAANGGLLITTSLISRIRKIVRLRSTSTADKAPSWPIEDQATVRGQVAHFWFDQAGHPVIHMNQNALIEHGFSNAEIDSTLRKIKKALLEAFSYLDESYSDQDTTNEQVALFQFQKHNKIFPGLSHVTDAAHQGMEIPLPIRVASDHGEEARVTPHEIILSENMIRAPPHVLALVFSHGLRRSIYRYEPDRQVHDAEIFEKTLRYFSKDPLLRKEWFAWTQIDRPASLFGRDWTSPFLQVDKLLRFDAQWRQINQHEDLIKELYDRLSDPRPRQTPARLTKIAKQILPRDFQIGKLKVYRELYRSHRGTWSAHVILVFSLGEGLQKIVRLLPPLTKDALSSPDASFSRTIAGVRVDILRDAQNVAGEAAAERVVLARFPQLLVWIDRIHHGTKHEKKESLRQLKEVARQKKETEFKKAAMDILFGMARSDPDFETRADLNRFVFDRQTGRPPSFPGTTFNFTAFNSHPYVVKTRFPMGNKRLHVRVRWKEMASSRIRTRSLKPTRLEGDNAYYRWTVPVQKGWVHYAIETRLPLKRWKAGNEPEQNGVIKFHDDIRHRRVLTLAPETFNMRLDDHNRPTVDGTGNVNVGTLHDLIPQLAAIKDQFDEIYLLALSKGAPGDAGSSASFFSPIDQAHLEPRIGGEIGFQALLKEAKKQGLEIALDMIPHLSRSNREAPPRTTAWVVDGGSGELVRQAATDGGLSPEWRDSSLRNWSDRRNIRDYLHQMETHSSGGVNRRVDVGHAFAKALPPHADTVGLARVRAEVVENREEWTEFEGEHRSFKTTYDLWRTDEVDTVLASIIYPMIRHGLQRGHDIKFYAENWHGGEARQLQAGAIPMDPLITNAWKVSRDGVSTQDFHQTVRWRADILKKFGGATGTMLSNHDAQVPVADAFGWRVFAAVSALIFGHGGLTFEHIHYSHRTAEGEIDWNKALADQWRVYPNNYGPLTIVNGRPPTGADWPGKIQQVEGTLEALPYLRDIGSYKSRVQKVTQLSAGRVFGLDVGHDRVIGLARELSPEGYLIFLSHQGPEEDNGRAYSADISFIPTHSQQKGHGLGSIEDQSIYKLAEVFNNEEEAITPETPGEPHLFSGRELNHLGWRLRFPLPNVGTRIYRFEKKKPAPSDERDATNGLLLDSLSRYRHYGPRDRFDHSFIAREIIRALESNDNIEDFFKLFRALSILIDERDDLNVSDLAGVFHDLEVYRPDLTPKVHEQLIRTALLSKESSPASSRTAVQVLRSASIGEVVLVSPETNWTSGTGGLSLYITDLSQELAELGINVTVIAPLFNNTKRKFFRKFRPRDTGRTFSVRFNSDGTETATAKIYEANVDKVRILALENDRYFSQLKGKKRDRQSAYDGESWFRLRFARMLSLGALFAIREMNIHASVIQTAEWSTGYLKEYLEGRDHIAPAEVGTLRNDPHLREAKVLHIMHNLGRDYQGRIEEADPVKFGRMMHNDLGLNPDEDWNVVSRPGEPHVINPTYTAIGDDRGGKVFGADLVGTVSQGYHDRSLDDRHHEEFGEMTGVLNRRQKRGEYTAIPNGFGLVQRQKKFFGTSFLEMGHEDKRRALAKHIMSRVVPERKKELQKAFQLRPDDHTFDGFVQSWLHRIGPQKGHQLLLHAIWDGHHAHELKAAPGPFEGIDTNVVSLSDEESAALMAYANEHRPRPLKAIEVALVLLPDLQIIIAGSVEQGEYYDRGFKEIAERWRDKGRFSYHPGFISLDDPRQILIYSGSTNKGHPSLYEPGGLANREAAAGGVVRQTTSRDGLIDSEITVKLPGPSGSSRILQEGFEPFNPVAWFRSERHLYNVYKTDRELWDEARYQALTQDNRWRRPAKIYIDVYRRLAGASSILELPNLEVAAAIHRAFLVGHGDPADELMRSGFTAREAVSILITALQTSSNEPLIRSLVEEHIPQLVKISDEVADRIQQKLEDLLLNVGEENIFERLKNVYSRLYGPEALTNLLTSTRNTTSTSSLTLSLAPISMVALAALSMAAEGISTDLPLLWSGIVLSLMFWWAWGVVQMAAGSEKNYRSWPTPRHRSKVWNTLSKMGRTAYFDHMYQEGWSIPKMTAYVKRRGVIGQLGRMGMKQLLSIYPIDYFFYDFALIYGPKTFKFVQRQQDRQDLAREIKKLGKTLMSTDNGMDSLRTHSDKDQMEAFHQALKGKDGEALASDVTTQLRLLKSLYYVLNTPTPSDQSSSQKGREPPPQALTGRWGGWPIYGILMPVLEEGARHLSTQMIGREAFLWPVILFPIFHSLAHHGVDRTATQGKQYHVRLLTRFFLSASFGIAYSMEPLMALLTHILYNLLALNILWLWPRMTIFPPAVSLSDKEARPSPPGRTRRPSDPNVSPRILENLGRELPRSREVNQRNISGKPLRERVRWLSEFLGPVTRKDIGRRYRPRPRRSNSSSGAPTDGLHAPLSVLINRVRAIRKAT